jgi:hypothetical protein
MRWSNTGCDGDELISQLSAVLEKEKSMLLLKLATICTSHSCPEATISALKQGGTCLRSSFVYIMQWTNCWILRIRSPRNQHEIFD